MNVLGTRTGVGGPWVDKNDMASSLRDRAIQLACTDAKNSLIACCGMAVVYGLCALTIGVATGITAQADLCGGPLDLIDGKKFLPVPPIGFILDQRMIHQQYTTLDGEKKTKVLIDRETFALSCCVDERLLEVYAFNLAMTIESPLSGKCNLLPMHSLLKETLC